MELIQALQGNRPIIVRVFDEMVRAVPEDLYFSAVTVKGTDVNIKGVAKSHNRVSALMRNFDQSDWFDNQTLVFITGKDESAWNFEISMRRVQPKAEEEEEMAEPNKPDVKAMMAKLNEFQLDDLNNIDWENMGSWPLLGKIVFCALIFIAVLAGGY